MSVGAPTSPPTTNGLRPAEQVRLIEQVRVAVLYNGRQEDLTLPANSPVAAVVQAILTLRADADADGGERGDGAPVDAIVARKATLTRINGEPLERGQTLAQQAVVEGDLLMLEIRDADVPFTPIVENASSAVAMFNEKRFTSVTEGTAIAFASVGVAVAALIATALLANVWRMNLAVGRDWNIWPAVMAAGLAVLLAGAGGLIWWRRKQLVVADALWLSALAVAPAAAVMGTPAHPGAWHAVFAAVTAAVGAVLLWQLTPAPRGVVAWVTITALGVVAVALIRAVWAVPMTYLWVGALAGALWVLICAAGIAARMAGIPLPPFPTITGKLVFDSADDIAAEALAAAEHQGTPSVEQLVAGAAAANTYLTALVASTSVFFVAGAVGAVSPGHGRWWLATVYVGILSMVLVLHGRAFTARVQAIIVVATGLGMSTALAVKYALVSTNPVMSVAVAAGVLGLGALGLVIAATVPARVFSPTFRKVVEWAEYALIVVVPVIALWLLNILLLARNH